MEDDGVIEQRGYIINFVFTITTYDYNLEEDITYQETIPYTFNYQDCFSLGDFTGDGIINILDIVALTNSVLVDSCDPDSTSYDENLACCAADTTDDGAVNVLDIVSLVNCVLSDSCSDDGGLG